MCNIVSAFFFVTYSTDLQATKQTYPPHDRRMPADSLVLNAYLCKTPIVVIVLLCCDMVCFVSDVGDLPERECWVAHSILIMTLILNILSTYFALIGLHLLPQGVRQCHRLAPLPPPRRTSSSLGASYRPSTDGHAK